MLQALQVQERQKRQAELEGPKLEMKSVYDMLTKQLSYPATVSGKLTDALVRTFVKNNPGPFNGVAKTTHLVDRCKQLYQQSAIQFFANNNGQSLMCSNPLDACTADLGEQTLELSLGIVDSCPTPVHAAEDLRLPIIEYNDDGCIYDEDEIDDCELAYDGNDDEDGFANIEDNDGNDI